MRRMILVLGGLALMSARLCAGEVEALGCMDYPPYSYADQQSGKRVSAGLDTEIVQAVFTRMERGFHVLLKEKRFVYTDTRTSQCSYEWPKDAADVRGLSVGPLRPHRMVFATRNDGPLTAWEKLEDLKPHRIGVIAGYVYDQYGQFYETQDLKKTEFYSGGELLAGLRDGKVDVVVGERCALVWNAKKLGILDKLKFSPKILYEDGRYIIFNDKEKELADEFQKALDEFKKTDKYAGILTKWETGAYELQADPTKATEIPLKDGILRINCGGEAFTDAEGNRWEADREFQESAWGAVGGKVVTRETKPVSGSKTEILYQTERYDLSGYRIPLKNGKYKVTLHFAETYEKTVVEGERVFSVAIEGKKCLESFDPFKEAGGKTWNAVVRSFDVQVKDGELTIEFSAEKQVPIVNGIEVVPAP